jgi:hypothetical protein
LTWREGNLWKNDWNNFGPSVGIAWDPFGRGKTSVRANYRLAYDRVPTFLISSFLLPNMPGSTLGVTNATFGAANGRLRNVPTLEPPRPAQRTADADSVFAELKYGGGSELRNPTDQYVELRYSAGSGNPHGGGGQLLGRRAHNLLGGYNVIRLRFATTDSWMRSAQLPAAARAGCSIAFSRATAGAALLKPAATLRAGFMETNLRQGNVGALANAIAQRAQSGTNLTDASGLGRNVHPSLSAVLGRLNVIDSNDFSTYHSLQMSINRQFQRGAQVSVSYVWSKSLDTRSNDPAFALANAGAVQSASSTPLDINNRRLNYALSNFDRTHSLLSNFVFELPFGRGQWLGNNAGGVVNAIIGGWQASGLFARYQWVCRSACTAECWASIASYRASQTATVAPLIWVAAVRKRFSVVFLARGTCPVLRSLGRRIRQHGPQLFPGTGVLQPGFQPREEDPPYRTLQSRIASGCV